MSIAGWFEVLPRLRAWLNGAILRATLCGACALLIGISAANTEIGLVVERQLRSTRDAVIERPASGEVVLVEIDAQSLRDIASWPWPRSVYAKAIDKLREGGAKIIAFDVDFSATSTPREDAAFAGALARAGGSVVLPTFVQSRRLGNAGMLENLPAPMFGKHAFLAAVNVFPDSDGVVRTYPYGIRTAGEPRPSLGALVAERQGVIDRSFVIDQSIQPQSIPRLSFTDLISGKRPPKTLNGKRFIIGATAIELGDRYAIPGRGVVPGALIQAQSAETLLQDRALRNFGPLPMLMLAILAIGIVFMLGRLRLQLATAAIAMAMIFLVVLGCEALATGTFAVAPAILSLGASCMIALFDRLTRAFDRARLTDRETGLGNSTAFVAAIRRSRGRTVVTARISRFAELASLLPASDLAQLMKRVADQTSYAADNGLVYRIDDSALAWIAQSSDHDAIAHALDGLSALFKSPVVVTGRIVEVRMSFGIAVTDGIDTAAALSKALFAADRADQTGERWLAHSTHLDDQADWNVTLLGELNEAMASGQIRVAYQPKFSLIERRVTGAEALVRWQHPTRGSIPPDRFIPVIEAHGDIMALTLFVLRDGIHVQQEWKRRGLKLGIAVNVSAALLRDDALARNVSELIAEANADADKITLEVTESAAIGEQEKSLAALTALRRTGVRLSIDDYGTGQSTLTYLRHLPATEIKIDKSFITDILQNRSDEILVRSTIGLAHELGLKVVAEGVETEEVLDRLATLGCDVVQGWHVGRPVAPSEFYETFAEPLIQAA